MTRSWRSPFLTPPVPPCPGTGVPGNSWGVPRNGQEHQAVAYSQTPADPAIEQDVGQLHCATALVHSIEASPRTQ